MRTRSLVIAVGTLALAFSVLTARDRAPADEAADRPADREAIVKSSQDFVAAFNKGDAKAIAALPATATAQNPRSPSRLKGTFTE